MKLSKLTFAVVTALSASVTTSAFAMDLYVDTKTKQIYAEPGKGRQKLGTFEKVDENAPQRSSSGFSSDGSQHLYQEVESSKEELRKVQTDLELKANEIKALEEHVVANRETTSKNDEKWFNKINLRGYTQMRYNQPLTGDRVANASGPELRSPGDSNGLGNNRNFSFRRMRLVFSGDINEYLSIYIQPDFATNAGDQHYAQLRDAYADIAFDKKHEYRIRSGISKIPFGWENLQSSQNRLSLDRNDALNSATPSERDMGLFAYWSPSDVQKLWKDLSKKGLKTSGDYGIVGLGVYNGQGLNKAELNDDFYYVAHTTYPVQLDFLGSMFKGQVFEVGADALTGKFNQTVSAITPFKGVAGFDGKTAFTPTLAAADRNGIRESRVGVHAILFPQPFGMQTEWNWGQQGTLNPENRTIERQSLNGGYVQVMYKIDHLFRSDDTLIPFVKWQTYDGAWKAAANAPRMSTEELDVGFEYQIMKPLEVVVTYTNMDRTNVANLGQASGDMIRTQLQWNY
jgi:hypothetical protein